MVTRIVIKVVEKSMMLGREVSRDGRDGKSEFPESKSSTQGTYL
jgi:hypothetical protein